MLCPRYASRAGSAKASCSRNSTTEKPASASSASDIPSERSGGAGVAASPGARASAEAWEGSCPSGEAAGSSDLSESGAPGISSTPASEEDMHDLYDDAIRSGKASCSTTALRATFRAWIPLGNRSRETANGTIHGAHPGCSLHVASV